MRVKEIDILLLLEGLSSRSNNTRALNRQAPVRGSKGVYTSHVPHQTLPRHPRNHRDTIWSLAITSEHPLWFESRRHVGGCQGTMDDIIQGSMPVVPTLTPSAVQPVSIHDIHLLSAMLTLVGAAQWCA